MEAAAIGYSNSAVLSSDTFYHPTCEGCRMLDAGIGGENQLAHMEPGGCLFIWTEEEEDEDNYNTNINADLDPDSDTDSETNTEDETVNDNDSVDYQSDNE
jgi:hypothetical protein